MIHSLRLLRVETIRGSQRRRFQKQFSNGLRVGLASKTDPTSERENSNSRANSVSIRASTFRTESQSSLQAKGVARLACW